MSPYYLLVQSMQLYGHHHELFHISSKFDFFIGVYNINQDCTKKSEII